MAVDLHCIGGAVNRDPPAAAPRQICLEQEAADALAVKRRVYEKQGDVAPLRRQDSSATTSPRGKPALPTGRIGISSGSSPLFAMPIM